MRVLVTGGAGFVGGNICVAFAERHPDWQLIAFDNLRRQGSQLNLPRLRGAGVDFVHGDVREKDDVLAVGEVDVVIEASAEPSVLAGRDDGVEYLVDTNLGGAYHCLELCRRHGSQLVFLSTSRVYPYRALGEVAYSEHETRFELDDEQTLPGVSARGVAERFPLQGPRTLYGATKLAAETLILDYADTFSLRVAIDRCGVISGPWQMGRVDQGIASFWLLAHRFGRPLSYLGFGGTGKQVRDLLHVDDLVDLLLEQVSEPERWAGTVFNVGGGRESSLSLVELTELCRELSGDEVEIRRDPVGRPGDVPIYVSDCSGLFAHTTWRPRRHPRAILEDVSSWAASNERVLRRALDLT